MQDRARDAKEMVEKVCECIEKTFDKFNIDDGEDFSNGARLELACFMMYLSASDGQIKWEEAEFISDVCDLDLTPSTLGDFIREQNIYSTEFENKVPATFQAMVTIDNELAKNDIDLSLSELLLNTYGLVGQGIALADEEVHKNEETDFGLYFNMLKTYRENNLISLSTKTTGFVKKGESSSVEAPAKKGSVEAPKKG